jgi:hypothetical protein
VHQSISTDSESGSRPAPVINRKLGVTHHMRQGNLLKRRSILALAILLGVICALFVTLAVIWRHDPMDAVHVPADRHTETVRSNKATGPLLRNSSNPRYFTDGSGKAVYLTGSHTWNNFQEKSDAPVSEFDYAGYLRLFQKEKHNFVRLWVWEQSAWDWTTDKVQFHPLPYERTGPGMALDGNPKFDLMQFNQAYFARLRSRVQAAGDRGIYVSVMLFQGWSIGKKPDVPGNPWPGHPFNRENNMNDVDGDLDTNGEGKEIHTLASPAIIALQERYVRKVVDTLNGCDNVLWEISNEGEPDSKEWQYHMIDYVKRYEAGKEKRHPVGMTAIYPGGHNADLFNSPADWISPNSTLDDYRNDPPAADGSKVIMTDTDHLWGVGGDRAWVWKSFARGLNPIYMDPFEYEQWKSSGAKFESCRQAMGDTLAYAKRMNLAKAAPRGDLASSRYCLADPEEEYLVYIPFQAPEARKVRLSFVLGNPLRHFLWQFKQRVTLNLSAATAEFAAEWFDPTSGITIYGLPIKGGKIYDLTSPFRGDAVLYLRRRAPVAAEKMRARLTTELAGSRDCVESQSINGLARAE